ncbi:MAG TPA: flagellar motor switch protein FliG [Armatimonadota bacterium]|nr:flagellar motor switch protein FliG [Armatimonadota bacterium]
MAVRNLKELNGVKKASVLLMSLGASASAEIFKYLDEHAIEMLASEIVRIGQVDPETRDAIISEFQRAVVSEAPSAGGRDFAAQVLEQALGQKRASLVMQKAAIPDKTKLFQSLRDLKPMEAVDLLAGEHPQIISLVLAYLPSEKAAAIISRLEQDLQVEVAFRICVMDNVDRSVITYIEEALESRLRRTEDIVEVAAGPDALVEILNNADRWTERLVLDALNTREPEIGQQVRKLMFVFEDILKLTDRSVQLVLREIDQEDLRYSLKACDEAFSELIFRNMSERAAETLKEDLELIEKPKTADVEAAQQRIASVVRGLIASGDAAIAEPEDPEGSGQP